MDYKEDWQIAKKVSSGNEKRLAGVIVWSTGNKSALPKGLVGLEPKTSPYKVD